MQVHVQVHSQPEISGGAVLGRRAGGLCGGAGGGEVDGDGAGEMDEVLVVRWVRCWW